MKVYILMDYNSFPLNTIYDIYLKKEDAALRLVEKQEHRDETE